MQKHTEYSLQVRCALAFREVLKVPLYINENLILGDMAAPKMRPYLP